MSVERRDAIARALMADHGSESNCRACERASEVAEAAVVEWERAHPPTFTDEQIERAALSWESCREGWPGETKWFVEVARERARAALAAVFSVSSESSAESGDIGDNR